MRTWKDWAWLVSAIVAAGLILIAAWRLSIHDPWSEYESAWQVWQSEYENVRALESNNAPREKVEAAEKRLEKALKRRKETEP